MSATFLEQILLAEENLMQAEKQLLEAKALEEKLWQQRNDGKLLYKDWILTADWHQWRLQQLERQKWQCAYCGKLMVFGKRMDLPNGGFWLAPNHPTVEHILPKSYFPKLTLDKQNLVMACWDCNRRKSNNMVEASRCRHQQMKQKLLYSGNLKHPD
jgi:5-methylcytosine-specific restriction endonuclease McrA